MSEQTRTTNIPPIDGLPEHVKPLVESLKKSEGLLGPYDVADHLQARIDELELADAIAHFREHGYTVIKDVAPPEEMDELREAIHSLSTEVPGTAYRGASHLLGRHPAIDRMATNPKILAFAEVSVGNGLRASQFAGSVMVKSENETTVHADQGWIPAPFPEQNCVITFCIPCEGMTAEGGATRVVPGSHVHRRHPTVEETHSETVAIEVEKGGLAVWDGSAWHGGGRRTVDGTRTVLHATYQRLYTQPIDDFSYLLKDEAYMATAPEGMRGLLGDGLFFGTGNAEGGVNMPKFIEATIRSKL
jgi:hypothetical protein